MTGRYKRSSNRLKENFTGTPSKDPQGFFKDKSCRECGNVFSPIAPSNHYCGDICAQRARDRRRMITKYNIDLEDYEVMVAEHNGFCAICGGEGFELVKGQRLKLVIDHCHDTGVVRGLLCHNCNRGIALLQDSVVNLKSAVRYLERFTKIDKSANDG